MFRDGNKSNPPSLQSVMTLILSAVMILLCGFRFIYSYKAAYNDDAGAGYFSPRDGVILQFVCIAVLAILVSVLLKIIWKRKLSLGILLAVSVVLPILCYQINYHTLKKDGMLYFLVEEGGTLHFVTIHDFNFDGVDDACDYTGDDVREMTGSTLSGQDPRGVIERMDYSIVGKGGKLQYAYCEAHYGDSAIHIHLNKSRVSYEMIRITLHLEESVDARTLILYQSGTRLAVTVVDEHTVSVEFDADTCAVWQHNALDESFRVSIRYVLDD